LALFLSLQYKEGKEKTKDHLQYFNKKDKVRKRKCTSPWDLMQQKAMFPEVGNLFEWPHSALPSPTQWITRNWAPNKLQWIKQAFWSEWSRISMICSKRNPNTQYTRR
jgi:hypothetical protein